MFKSLSFIAWIQRLLKNDDEEDDTWSVIPISYFNKYGGLKFLLRSSNCDKKFPKDSDIPSFYKDILFPFLDLRMRMSKRWFSLQRLSVTRALQRFIAISKTAFWWTSIKCIHDNNGERSFWNHYFLNVNSQSIRVALSSLLDSSINRNWEIRLIKSFEASFRSSRSRPMLWSCKSTNSVYNHNMRLNWI